MEERIGKLKVWAERKVVSIKMGFKQKRGGLMTSEIFQWCRKQSEIKQVSTNFT